MPFSPAILALTASSWIVVFLVLLAAGFALQVVRHWDIASGSERQLQLERRTYLISTILTYTFAIEIVALLLYVYNAEQMSPQFVGAMCATGVLNVNGYGWPTLFLKIVVFFLAAVWLMLNYIDNKGYDYPLVRTKYLLLLVIAPLVAAEAAVQTLYFVNLEPDVITSCCGSLFSASAKGVAAELAGLAPKPAMIAFYGMAAALVLSGVWLLRRGSGGPLFAGLSLVVFMTALAAIVSFVSLYVYEQPHHHCPFCVLKSGHDYIGYYFYVPLFAGAALGLGAGVLAPLRRVASLRNVIGNDVRRFAGLALVLLGLFYAVATWAMLRSNLVLLGG